MCSACKSWRKHFDVILDCCLVEKSRVGKPARGRIMSIHYKFNSAKDFDTITFDAPHIQLGELKRMIASQKRVGNNDDLVFEDANSHQLFEYDSTLIPKNTSLIVKRQPGVVGRSRHPKRFPPSHFPAAGVPLSSSSASTSSPYVSRKQNILLSLSLSLSLSLFFFFLFLFPFFETNKKKCAQRWDKYDSSTI